MTAPESERLARIALNQLYEPGDQRVAGLAGELGAERLLAELLAQPALRDDTSDIAGRLNDLDPVRVLEQASRRGARFVVPGDDEWPSQLDDLCGVSPLHQRGGPPLGLWVRGPLRLDRLARSVAVVGSRSATSYGTRVAEEIAAVLAAAELPVVSGAAFGIDVAAHHGALGARGSTVAVLACGVDRIYPEAHRRLLDHLATHGAVISETPPGGAPLRIRFLARNRLIAALARGTVLVEAALRSGALNTAHWAERLHRPVMGVPGPVTSAASQGVHQFIRNGGATLVTSGAEVLEMLGSSGDHLLVPAREEAHPRDRLTARTRQVLDAVPVHAPATTDSIARTAGVSLVVVRGALGALTRRGLVEQMPTGWRLRRDEPA